METVRSADGTTIAFARSGAGPPLVIVGGALSDHTAAAPLLPHLESDLTVYVPDRRGRGTSGDERQYEVDREVEDIAALLDRIGEQPHLYGHSSGGILALEAVIRGLPVGRLVVYEPPFIVDEQRPRPPADLAERLGSLIAANDRDGALRTFLREGPMLPDASIDQIQGTAQWQAWLPLAHTTAYDARIAGACILPLERLAALRTPTLVLQGGASPGWVRSGTEALARALPRGRLVALAGQSHAGAREAPERVAREVIRFLTAPD